MAWLIDVKKRLGKIEKFRREKIALSIFKAAQRVGGRDKKLAETLSWKVEEFLKNRFSEKQMITTDEIGEAVEKTLIEEGHARTAKTFILYREGQRRTRKKLIKLKDLSRLSQFLRLTDQKVVFVTGIYDLLHIGHARYLKKASLQGDVLVVGLNSDESTKKLKSISRPILGEEIRAEILSYLDFVDFIVIFSETHAANIISNLEPDVYVCVEGSWEGEFEKKPEVIETRRLGVDIVVLPRQAPEISTTAIFHKIQKDEKVRTVQLVSSAIFLEDGRILLVKQRNHDFWTPPGGFVEPGEDPKKACLREAREELGIDLLYVYGVLPPAVIGSEKSSENLLVLNYLVRRDRSQKININTKENQQDDGGVESYQWLKLDEIDNFPVTSSILPVVEELRKGLKLEQKFGADFEIQDSADPQHSCFMDLALEEAKKSTCFFRKTGCLLVKDDTVLLSAYNKVMPEEDFCQNKGCLRQEFGALPGERLELCTAIHAEANLIALASQRGISLKEAVMYLTTFPCSICAKTIALTGIKRLVFDGEYSNAEGLSYLKKGKIEVIKLVKNDQ